ncbi:MAG: ABC-type lipopolysaccharide export system permease component LptF [Rhodobacteraceae bacterium HLUCCA12]|nr:MAG: ABC-type lipopolysaccharide export system permease component LptF [Rhodobacteraceae bacterium HLUCCA12]
MARLDRYILSQLLRVFAFFALVLISVYWVNRAARLFDQLISDGQPLLVFLELTALSLPMLIRTVLPVAAFVATVYVTHGLLRSNEMAVMQAAGLSPYRLAWPIAVFGLIVAGFLLVLMHLLIPSAYGQLSERHNEIAQNVSAGLLQEGVFQHPGGGITFFIAEITQDGALNGIYLSDTRSMERRIDYTASSALIVPEASGPKLVMIDGFAQIYDNRTGRLATTTFSDFTYDLGALIGPAGGGRSVQELSTGELFRPGPALIAETGATAAQLRFELVSRFVDAFAAVATALVGYAALIAGGFSRLGFWREVLLAVALLVVLQTLANFLAGEAMRSVALSWLGLVPLGLSFAVAFALMRHAARRRRPGAPAATDGAAP